MIVPPDPNEAIRYRFDGVYAPLEASNYLRAGLPEKLQRQQPPTSQRIIRWVRGGLVAADRSHEKGREIILNFEDFITCQAITIFYEAGHSIPRIKQMERDLVARHGIEKPFAHKDFWFDRWDILERHGERYVISGVRQRHQMGWLELLSDGMKLLSDKLGFSPETGMAVTWEPHDLDRVLLRPDVRFGQPCIKATRVPTWVLWSHVEGNGGPRPDTYRYVADAFAVNEAAVEQAYVWEQRVQQPLATQGQILD